MKIKNRFFETDLSYFLIELGYTSSRLISKRSFKYGIFEMSAKLPPGRGVWSAFWLLSATRPLNWPRDGEIGMKALIFSKFFN